MCGGRCQNHSRLIVVVLQKWWSGVDAGFQAPRATTVPASWPDARHSSRQPATSVAHAPVAEESVVVDSASTCHVVSVAPEASHDVESESAVRTRGVPGASEWDSGEEELVSEPGSEEAEAQDADEVIEVQRPDQPSSIIFSCG